MGCRAGGGGLILCLGVCWGEWTYRRKHLRMAMPFGKSYSTGDSLKRKRNVAYKTLDFNEVPEILYEHFFEDYLVPNKPCLFNQKLTENWRSRREWVQFDGAPNFEFLRFHFGVLLLCISLRLSCKCISFRCLKGCFPFDVLTLHL